MASKLFQSLYLPVFSIAFLCIFFQCSHSAPVDAYSKFVRDLNSSKCLKPDQINVSTSEITDNTLSAHLTLCQNLENVPHHKEALYLCQEILENLKVILCPPISAKVLAANMSLSKNVCKDIESVKDGVTEDKVMLKRLTDVITCELMCDDVFENACKVLLWSHQLQQQSGKNDSSQKEAKDNSLQAGLEAAAGAKNSAEDQNNAKQDTQKTTATEQKAGSTGTTKGQGSNELLPTIQKSTSVKKEQQTQVTDQGNSGINVPSPPETQPKEQGLNDLPLSQNNVAVNNSQKYDAKVAEIKTNELPGEEVEYPNPNAGLQEQDPHDQELNRISLDKNVNIPQDNTLPQIKVQKEPKKETPEQNESQDKLPKNPSGAHVEPEDEHVEPHDAEEPGEEVFEENEPKSPSETDKQNNSDKPITNEHGQSKIPESKTTPDKASSTQKQQLSEATTKKLTTPTNKETEKTLSTSDLKTTAEKTLSTTDKKTTAEKTFSTSDQKTTAEKTQTTLDKKTSLDEKTQSTSEQKTSESASSVQSGILSSTSKDFSFASPALEEMEGNKDVHERPEDREPDTYTDLEHTEGDADDDYDRQEYGGLYEQKNKVPLPDKPNEDVSKLDNMRPREPSYNDFSPRNTFNRQPEVMPIFPDQEDGHFFFYFLSIVLILMGGYLLFHNKQKIIALIVEGRHERRRRSHGVGYKKLETK